MRTQLLAALKEADDYISGQELCEHFGVSRTAIWKAVKQLKEAGYVIEAVQNKGYKIVSTPDCLNTAELESIRKTKWAGREIFYFDTIDSTNTKAKQLAEEGHPTGTLVFAERYCDERQKSLWNLNGDERTVRLYQPCCHRYRY